MKIEILKPRLGQHFLKNIRVVRTIIHELALKESETIIEIGPGEGALTTSLVATCKEKNCSLIAIEKDPVLAEALTKQYAEENHVSIVHGDALKILQDLAPQNKPYTVVGNIPYYITGKLLRVLSELPKKPGLAILMVQKEVAERIVSKPPDMNLLAAAVQVWAEPTIIARLKPGDFNPPPEVDSAVIKLACRKETLEKEQSDAYYAFVRTLFKQPRKTVFNNLRAGYPKRSESELKRALEDHKVSPEARPQDISLLVLIKLASYFYI